MAKINVFVTQDDLSQYAKKSDQKVPNTGNKYQELANQSDTSLVKLKALGVKDYTPQTDPSFNQDYHLENPAGFMNDMQSIFKDRQGLWHVYYLNEPTWDINGERGNSNWQHATSTDGTHWVNDDAIAIKSHRLDGAVKWGTIATGSVVISDGTIEGTNDGDFVAFFSSFGAENSGGQSIWAAISKDNGVTFHSLYDDAVMPNHENFPDFRDPCVMKHNGKWVMYTAEGQKIGTYNSSDGKNWTYVGGTITTGDQFSDGFDYGLIECPYVAQIQADDGSTHWLMFFGCNDYHHGHGAGTSYLIGNIDENGVFTKVNKETVPVRVDIGTDYYGANFGKIDEKTLITSSWVSNWDYALEPLTGVDGTQCKKLSSCALFRDLELVANSEHPSGYALKQTVRDIVNRDFAINDDYDRYYDIQAGGEVLSTIRNSSIVDFTVNSDDGTGFFTVDVRQDDAVITLFFDITAGATRIKRHLNGNFTSEAFNKETVNVAYGEPNPKKTEMTIYFDNRTLEIEFKKTGKVFTLLKNAKRSNPSTTLSLQSRDNTLHVNHKVYQYK